MDNFTDEELDALLPYLVHEGYLVEERLPNGKIWYKRTDKQLPAQEYKKNETD